MSRVQQQPAERETKKELIPKESHLVISLRRFATFEVYFYFILHLLCFGLILFAPGDVPIYARGRGLLRQHREQPPISARNAFDVFRNTALAARAAPVPHQVSADLVLTLLLIFTTNATVLALVQRVLDFLQRQLPHIPANTNQANGSHATNEEATMAGDELRAACHDVVKDTLMNVSTFFCIATALGVMMQPSNQVRGIGPIIVLMSFVLFMCVLQAHGGMEAVVRIVKGYQAIIVAALVYLIADANVFSAGLK